MEAVALVVLREVVEIAIILGVVLAATRGIAGRAKYIWGGLVAGVIGSFLIALFAKEITEFAHGFGQEVMNASILFLAALMIGWTTVWMKVHGKELSQRMKQVGSEIRSGDTSFYVLSAIIALAMFREGSEIVLFSYGMMASGVTVAQLMAGAALGFAGGTVIGTLFYFGMIKAFAKHFFTVTSIMLTLLAAGMAAKAAQYLVSADMLPAWGDMLWDTSWLLSEESYLGEFLSVLIGYSAQPSGMWLAVYVATVVLIQIGIRYSQAAHDRRKNAGDNPSLKTATAT